MLSPPASVRRVEWSNAAKCNGLLEESVATRYTRDMKKRFRFLFLFVVGILCGCGNGKEDATASWCRLPDEAGMRMYAYASAFVTQNSPRDAGTPGAARASRWLAQEIRRMGLTPIADCWIEDTAFGRQSFCNIYVDFPGTSGQTIVLGSHYDTKSGIPGFQGANDGASSTAVLLGLIEHFSQNPPLIRDTIRFAFFDGEECRSATYRDDDGLHGSTHLARYYGNLLRTQGYSPLLACIVIDMVGDKDLALEIPRNVSPWLGRAALKIVQNRKDMPNITLADTFLIDDHMPFIVQHLPAINFIDYKYGSAPGRHDYWHTPQDTLDKISADSLHKTGAFLLALLARIESDADVPAGLRKTAKDVTDSAPQP